MGRERLDHVAKLDTRAPWPRYRAKTREEHAGHLGFIVGQLGWTCKRLIPTLVCAISDAVNRLIEYLRQNMMIDFQGDLSVAKVRELLAGDDTRDAKNLLAKLVAERKVEDFILVLADCLGEAVQKALTDEVMREQIRMYAES
jgi:hypothetical protein